jgi:deoxyribonuclease-4
MGLSAIELGWVRSVRVSESTCHEIKQTALEHDILISVHAPYFINLNADSEEWPKSRQRLMDAAYYGHLAGATDIIFHPGSYFGKSPAEVLPIAIKRLAECVEELREKNIFVTLRPETMGKSAMLGSLEDTLDMSLAMDGVQPCLDFPHLHARTGDGSMNSYDEWAAVLRLYAERLGDTALEDLHIHMSGIEYTEKGEKNHLRLDEADLDLEAILQALREFNCSGRILCESPVLEEDAIVLKNAWEKIAETGDE